MADAQGALDGVVDSIVSASTQTPSVRARNGQATTARGESPAVDARPNYHLDTPVDRRQPFAKSAADDGGLSVLASPNERGPSTREALMAADQSDVQGVVVMKPRSVEVQRGDGRAKRGSGAIMSSDDVGLALQPIKIQRQADVTTTGQAYDAEGIKPRTFISDGTVNGLDRINRGGAVTVEEAMAKTAAAAPAAQAAPSGLQPRVPDSHASGETGASAPVQTGAVMMPQVPQAQRKRQRVIFTPPGGGKIRTNVDHVVIGNGIIILMYDANADTSYEPPKAGAENPIGLQIGDKQFRCLYNDWSAEDEGTLYLVLVTVPDAPAS